VKPEALALNVVVPGATPVTLAEPTTSPAAMVNVAGAIVAMPVLSLASVTFSPPAGAGRESVTVAPSVRPVPTSAVPPPTWPARVRVMLPGSVVVVVVEDAIVVVVSVVVVVVVLEPGPGESNS